MGSSFPKPVKRYSPDSSRKAAKECGPQPALSLPKGRKLWVTRAKWASPGGAKDTPRAIFAIPALLLILATTGAFAIAPAFQDSPDTLFTQAVDAYNHNQFAQALAKFQQVSGPHAQESQQYIAKINAYQEAMQVAKSAMERTADEQDANNLAFAIQQLEKAIKIKSDGPFDPQDRLAKAREMKAQFEKTHSASSQAMDVQFCAKALAAAQEHHFKEAAQLICAVANDNPAYSCGGDEAVHMCQQDTDLAKLDKTPPEKSAPPRTAPDKATTPPVEPSAPPVALDNAKVAYDSNNFDRARTLFQRVDPDSKSTASDYLDKISRYTDAMATAEKQNRAGQYEPARASFLAAAAIKPDGPGDPQTRASAMQLLLGLDHFYSGDYVSAIQLLQDYSRTGTEKQPLARFYLGASKLARFFVTGSEDSTLHQEALNDLKMAKQAGFKTTGHDVSPKILQAYKDLQF
jgi:tetratricopeptide (TPR) repeat protein